MSVATAAHKPYYGRLNQPARLKAATAISSLQTIQRRCFDGVTHLGSDRRANQVTYQPPKDLGSTAPAYVHTAEHIVILLLATIAVVCRR